VPELPEVETVRRNIEAALVGRAVDHVALTLPKLLRDSPLPDLAVLKGQKVVAARRRAKVLVVDFDGELSLMAHLKLSGQVAILAGDGRRFVAGHPVPDPNGPYPHKTTHLTLSFDDGTTLYLSDVRQFGWLRLMPTPEVESTLAAFRFGPEGAGERIGPEELGRRLARRRIPAKQALLDQAVLAGLGNIYVDEALHKARVHPNWPANALRPDDLDRLAAAIPWALARGLEQGGATIVNNRAVPRDGFPEVHGRAGEACPACGTSIVKIRVGGRGTYLCPSCQQEP
jgi:formamidopyrimidine-DNA glycosylase